MSVPVRDVCGTTLRRRREVRPQRRLRLCGREEGAAEQHVEHRGVDLGAARLDRGAHLRRSTRVRPLPQPGAPARGRGAARRARTRWLCSCDTKGTAPTCRAACAARAEDASARPPPARGGRLLAGVARSSECTGRSSSWRAGHLPPQTCRSYDLSAEDVRIKCVPGESSDSAIWGCEFETGNGKLPERLRGRTRNPLGSARAGSSPAFTDSFFPRESETPCSRLDSLVDASQGSRASPPLVLMFCLLNALSLPRAFAGPSHTAHGPRAPRGRRRRW